jgi:tellurite resistance protein TerC
MFKKTLVTTYQLARRIVVAVIGVTVLLIGIALIVLPGPAVVVIPAGLAILSLEFAWARHWLAKFRDGANQAWNRLQNRGEETPPAG